MTDDQFSMLMERLSKIDEKLYALVVSGANQEIVANAIVESMSGPAEEASATDPYFNQRLLRGEDLSAG